MFEGKSARTMRVLSVAHTAVSNSAGRMRYEPLGAEHGLEIHLVCPARWYQFGRWLKADPASGQAVTLHTLPIRMPRAGPASWYLHWYPGLGSLVRRLRPDILHLWEEPWSVVALQAALLKGSSPDTALVLEVDQNILKRLPLPFEWIRRFVLRRTTLVLSRSDEATRVVRACGYRGPVRPIAYGVDQAVFQPAAQPTPRPHASALHIGYVGRLIEEKGLDDALDALALTGRRVTLAIMGEGPYRARLEARAAALGLADRVSFRGWGEPAEVAAFIQTLDALVLLTRTTRTVREQFGRVIIEAQACGVPVIGSSSGVIAEVIGAGGFVVPEHDGAALAALLERLAARPQALQTAARAAPANVAARFSFARVAKSLAQAWYDAASATAAAGYGRVVLPQISRALSVRIEQSINQPVAESKIYQ